VEGGDNRLMGRVTVKKMKSIRQWSAFTNL
jgi:hypothetical protein